MNNLPYSMQPYIVNLPEVSPTSRRHITSQVNFYGHFFRLTLFTGQHNLYIGSVTSPFLVVLKQNGHVQLLAGDDLLTNNPVQSIWDGRNSRITSSLDFHGAIFFLHSNSAALALSDSHGWSYISLLPRGTIRLHGDISLDRLQSYGFDYTEGKALIEDPS